MKTVFIVFMFFVVMEARAQQASSTHVRPKVISEAMKKTFVMEYHSWFQGLTFSPSDGSGNKNVEAIYYGFAFIYDTTKYFTNWGWGAHGGLGQGFAVATGENSSYSQKRLPWTYFRGGGRIFRRLNGRMDLGLNALVLKNSINFPDANGSVVPGASPFISLFLELRWRLDRRWEMIQALGSSQNNPGANLRLGFGNTF